MKTILLAILGLFIALNLSAQGHRFADTTAQWSSAYYQDNWPPMYPSTTTITVYKVFGDTMINNIMYQKINEFCLRKSSDSVIYSWDGVRDNKLYSFAAAAGDSVTGIKMSYELTLTCIIDSVSTMQLTGPRKKMYVSCHDSGGVNHQFTDTWVEGIGSLRYNSIRYTGLDLHLAHTDEYLSCFFENGIQYYSAGACFNTAINEVTDISATLYPNPTDGSFTVTLSEQPKPNTSFIIYDELGGTLKRETLISGTQQISVGDLSAGVYTFAVMLNNIRQASGKLVIAK